MVTKDWVKIENSRWKWENKNGKSLTIHGMDNGTILRVYYEKSNRTIMRKLFKEYNAYEHPTNAIKFAENYMRSH